MPLQKPDHLDLYLTNLIKLLHDMTSPTQTTGKMMEQQIQSFNKKRTQLSNAIEQLHDNCDALFSANPLSETARTEINNILNSIRWIEQTLAKATFNSSNEIDNRIALNVYDEIADNTLNVINQGQLDFKHILQKKPSEKAEYVPPS